MPRNVDHEPRFLGQPISPAEAIIRSATREAFGVINERAPELREQLALNAGAAIREARKRG